MKAELFLLTRKTQNLFHRNKYIEQVLIDLCPNGASEKEREREREVRVIGSSKAYLNVNNKVVSHRILDQRSGRLPITRGRTGGAIRSAF